MGGYETIFVIGSAILASAFVASDSYALASFSVSLTRRRVRALAFLSWLLLVFVLAYRKILLGRTPHNIAG